MRREFPSMKLPSLRISHRIALIALAGVIGMLAVTGMFIYERSVLSALEQTEAEAQETGRLSEELERDFAQLQILEKDFFLNKQELALTAHARKIEELNGKIEQIEAIIESNAHRDLPEAGQLTEVFRDYESAFAIAASTSQRLGLNSALGLQLALRTAGAALAEDLARVPLTQLRLDAAQIFLAERNFTLTPTKGNEDAIKDAIQGLRQRPQGVFGGAERYESTMLLLDKYELTFRQFAREATLIVQYQKDVADTYAKLQPIFTKIHGEVAAIQEEVAAQKLEMSTTIQQVVFAVIAGLLVLIALGGLLAWRSVARPITQTARSMRELADGALDIQVPGLGRRDEIGEIATAFELFRENTVRRVQEERQAEEQRQRAAMEREARENEEKAEQARQLQEAVDRLADGLAKLAEGDVAQSIDEPFTASLEKLRHDFNNSVARLNAALAEVGMNATAIHAGSDEIRQAADDLSTRTEQQAASVEETAAALEQMVATVRDSSRRAEEAGMLVNHTREGAERSGVIVQDAIMAMDRIAESSDQIGNIIGVIDEIAFQISLLALNAGIEAARAGDAGRGFAVVAQEVRELAQRSANAAKEINTLISASGVHVRSGVSLVGEAGKALETIVSEVQEISVNVAAIVEAAREQATGLTEINIAVNRIDQGTQQNAAMVEETTAASHKLATEAASLQNLLEQFKLEADRTRNRSAATFDNAKPANDGRYASEMTLASSAPRAVVNAGTSAAALLAPDQEEWEEF